VAEKQPETRDVWQLARAIGIDVHDERNRHLLAQAEIAPVEAAELLRVSRVATHEAVKNNRVAGVRRMGVGKRSIPMARPHDWLVFAVNRPLRDRYVDRSRAELYAAEEGRALDDEAGAA
jgi:hypothetical protein